MYRLFSRIPKGLEPVADAFKRHVEADGMALVKEATEAAAAKAAAGETCMPNPLHAGPGVCQCVTDIDQLGRRLQGKRQASRHAALASCMPTLLHEAQMHTILRMSALQYVKGAAHQVCQSGVQLLIHAVELLHPPAAHSLATACCASASCMRPLHLQARRRRQPAATMQRPALCARS